MSDPKPQVILELEQEFGFKLKEIRLDEIWAYNSERSFSKNEKEQITGLNLSITQVSDIEILKDLTNLEALDISNTQVNDIEALKGLRQSEKNNCPKNVIYAI